jgi:2-C-methyl-D-erythritol 2,4-cyclodiphosphate synthase
MRIGTGYDVHKLVEGRDLIIGGVKIEHTLGLLGHSDADVLLHAIADAVVGAAGLKDIGAHFPDTDPKYKGADSMKLLEQVRELVMDEGYVVGNVDATVIAQAPKLRPFIEQMEENVARCLGIDVSQVNIKATTEEHLGFTGREEGISAQAVCLLYEFYDGSSVVYDSARNCEGCSGCARK